MEEAMPPKLPATLGIVAAFTPFASFACILLAIARTAVTIAVRSGSFISACVVQVTASALVAESKQSAIAPAHRRKDHESPKGATNHRRNLRSIVTVTRFSSTRNGAAVQINP
jgi:hypothetical protein